MASSVPNNSQVWPRGLMDKASDFESEDCEFESRRGHNKLFLFTHCQQGIRNVLEKFTTITAKGSVNISINGQLERLVV